MQHRLRSFQRSKTSPRNRSLSRAADAELTPAVQARAGRRDCALELGRLWTLMLAVGPINMQIDFDPQEEFGRGTQS